VYSVYISLYLIAKYYSLNWTKQLRITRDHLENFYINFQFEYVYELFSCLTIINRLKLKHIIHHSLQNSRFWSNTLNGLSYISYSNWPHPPFIS